MTEEKFEKTISLLEGALDYDSFRDVDIVIEVVYASHCVVDRCSQCLAAF